VSKLRAFGALFLASLALGACGSSSQATPTVDAALIDSGTAKKDSGFLDFDAPPYDGGPVSDSGPPPEGPLVVGPDGWANLVGFDECPMQVAMTPAAMPPGITWVPCPSSVNLPAGACRRIALDFPDYDPANNVMAPEGIDIEGGDVRLSFLRTHLTYYEQLVASASGPVLAAVRNRSRNTGCGPRTADRSAGAHYAVPAFSNEDWRTGRLFTGTLGAGFGTLKRYPSNSRVSVFATRQGILEQRDGLHRLDWTTGADTTLAAVGTDAFADIGQFAEVGTRLYAHAGFPFHVYEYSSGTPKRILTAGRDATEVGSFAVDDARIAWTSIVPVPGTVGYAQEALYVQDFPNGVLSGVRQRLPPAGRQSYSQSAVMNCGILARIYGAERIDGVPVSQQEAGLEIFDFKAMKHWRLPMPIFDPDRTRVFGSGEVKAVTCGEVFTTTSHFEPFSVHAQYNFARFDLSKIGPGEAFTMTPDPVP